MVKKYFYDIWQGIFTVTQGMSLTFRHLKNARKSHSNSYVDDDTYFLQDKGIVTLSYPYEKLPVPDHGRYKLHNEMDDCIVCDKCAVICPVDCIAIDAIKSSEPIGITSDGSVKRLYAATFDIDMAKCCFCGLCTSVCPTECLTMTNEYDFSTYSVKEMNFEFANLPKEEADEKRKMYDLFVQEKEALKKQKEEQAQKIDLIAATESTPKVGFKPMIKPVQKAPEIVQPESAPTAASAPVPAIKMPIGLKPIIKPVIKKEDDVVSSESTSNTAPVPAIKMPIGLKPIIKPVIKKEDDGVAPESTSNTPPAPSVKMPVGLKPIIKPVIKKVDPPSENA